MRERKSECSWDNGLDFDGLNECDRKRIKEIGLRKWIVEITNKQKKKGKADGHPRVKSAGRA